MHENEGGEGGWAQARKRLKRICFRFCHYIYAIVNNMTRIENNITEKKDISCIFSFICNTERIREYGGNNNASYTGNRNPLTFSRCSTRKTTALSLFKV